MATILVADDGPANLQFMAAVLAYAGHHILAAADGAEALARTLAERPDLIITDIIMPIMNRYELVRQVRAVPAVAGTPVIFFTAACGEAEAGESATCRSPCGPRSSTRLAWNPPSAGIWTARPSASHHDLLATGMLKFARTGFAERPSVALSPLSGGPAGATTFVIADLGLVNGANLLYNGVTVADGTILGFATVGGASTGLVNIMATGFPTGNQFTLSRSTEYVIVSFSPVPEPTATLTASGAAVAAAGWWRRRRTSQRVGC